MADETIILKIEVEGADASTRATADLTKAIENQTQSIATLRAQNKQLTQERNQIDTSTDTGRKKIEELNKQLDLNNATIKKNVDSLSKQRLGIGDYSGAIDKLVPGLGATVSGFQGMTKSALAFIATPIGAVIGALGLALGALTAYFKGSEEGQDRLAKAMAVGKFIFEQVIQVVEKLGEVIADTIGFVGNLAMKALEFIAPQIAAQLDAAIEAGSKIADLQDKIDADENILIVKRAETNEKVAALRAAAIKQEGDQKRATIQEAIELEKQLSIIETQHAQEKLALIQADIEATGKATEEQKKAQAEAEAEVINQRARADEATLRFQKELERLNDEEAKKAAIREERIANDEIVAQRETERIDKHISDIVKSTEIELTSIDKVIAATQKSMDAKIKADTKETESEKMKTRVHQLEQQNRLANISAMLGQAQVFFEKDSAGYKAMAIGRATVDTYRAADAALAEFGGWPFGIPAMLATIGLGLAQVAKIAGIGFAEGGYTGDGGKYAPAGIVHRGEYVVPAHIVANPAYSGYLSGLEQARTRGYADGGFVTNSATAQIDTGQAIANAMKNMPPIYASWTEGVKIGTSIDFKESLTSL